MILELLRAMVAGSIIIFAWYGLTGSKWQFFRAFASIIMLWIGFYELTQAILHASDASADMGTLRKAGWPFLISLAIAYWYGPKWLPDGEKEATT